MLPNAKINSCKIRKGKLGVSEKFQRFSRLTNFRASLICNAETIIRVMTKDIRMKVAKIRQQRFVEVTISIKRLEGRGRTAVCSVVNDFFYFILHYDILLILSLENYCVTTFMS